MLKPWFTVGKWCSLFLGLVPSTVNQCLGSTQIIPIMSYKHFPLRVGMTISNKKEFRSRRCLEVLKSSQIYEFNSFGSLWLKKFGYWINVCHLRRRNGRSMNTATFHSWIFKMHEGVKHISFAPAHTHTHKITTLVSGGYFKENSTPKRRMSSDTPLMLGKGWWIRCFSWEKF